MKRVILVFLCICCPALAEEVDYDKLSETLGHLLVRHLVQPGFECKFDKVIKGIEDAQAGKPSPLSEEEYEQAIYAIQENLFLQAAEKNLVEAEGFLKDNKDREEVQEIDQKLQYRITKNGEGEATVGPDSIPLIQYKGSLIDGTVFANSDEPLHLPIKQSIPGLSRGLLGMKEGEKRILYIHPELAFGVSGNLPPNSLLIFEVEVVKTHTQNGNEMPVE